MDRRKGHVSTRTVLRGSEDVGAGSNFTDFRSVLNGGELERKSRELEANFAIIRYGGSCRRPLPHLLISFYDTNELLGDSRQFRLETKRSGRRRV